jgi:hypothetical protein
MNKMTEMGGGGGYFVDCNLALIMVVDCRLKGQNICRL